MHSAEGSFRVVLGQCTKLPIHFKLDSILEVTCVGLHSRCAVFVRSVRTIFQWNLRIWRSFFLLGFLVFGELPKGLRGRTCSSDDHLRRFFDGFTQGGVAAASDCENQFRP